MNQATQGSVSRSNRKVPARAWRLSVLATIAGIGAGALAVILEGTPCALFAGAAIVLLVTAFFCIGVTALESQSGPPVDPDEPPTEPPVPQSEVTSVYDPKETPNKAFQRTLEDSRR